MDPNWAKIGGHLWLKLLLKVENKENVQYDNNTDSGPVLVLPPIEKGNIWLRATHHQHRGQHRRIFRVVDGPSPSPRSSYASVHQRIFPRTHCSTIRSQSR